MEQFTLLFRGAAVGTFNGEIVDRLLGGNLSPLPGFEVLRETVSDASRALANHGFLPQVGARAGDASEAGAAAFAQAQAMCEELELRDSRGQFIPTDWINVFGARTAGEPISVMATVNRAPSAVSASLPQRRGRGPGSEPRAS